MGRPSDRLAGTLRRHACVHLAGTGLGQARRGWPAVLLAGALLGLCGCNDSILRIRPDVPVLRPAPDVWPVSLWASISPSTQRGGDPLTLAYAGQGRIALRAAAGETVAVQLVIRAGETPLRDLRVSAVPATRPEGLAASPVVVRLYRLWFVEPGPVQAWEQIDGLWPARREDQPRSGGLVGDGLLLLDAGDGAGSAAAGQEVPALSSAGVWVELAVGRDALAGEYGWQIELAAAGHEPVHVGLDLAVLDFALPEDGGLAAVGRVNLTDLWQRTLLLEGRAHAPRRMLAGDPLAARARAVAAATALELARHGVQPLLYPLPGQIVRDADGGLLARFDDEALLVSVVREALSAEPGLMPGYVLLPGEAARLPQDLAGPSERAAGARLEAQALLPQWLAAAQAWWPGATVLVDLSDMAPADGAELAALQEAALLAEQASAGGGAVLVAVGLGTVAQAPLGRLDAVWAEPAGQRLLHVATADRTAVAGAAGQADRAGQAGDGGVGLVRGVSPLPPGFLPTLHIASDGRWLAGLAGLPIRSGIGLLWLADVVHTPPDARLRASLDSRRYLLYPPDRPDVVAPMPSVRLKRLHRVLQDAAYLELLSRLESARAGAGGGTGGAGAGQLSAGRLSAELAGYLLHHSCGEQIGEHWQDPAGLGWSTAADRAEQVRAIAQRLIQSYLGGSGPAAGVDVGLAALRADTRPVQARILSARLIRPAGVPELELLVRVQVRGVSRGAAKGASRLGVGLVDLPEGWRSVGEPVRVEAPGPGERREILLRARLGSQPYGPRLDGTERLGVKLEPEGGLSWVEPLAVGIVVSREWSGPRAQLDADLDDWPLPVGNQLTADRLIRETPGVRADSLPGGGPVEVSAPVDALAEQARAGTLVLLAHDAMYVYIGIRCEAPPARAGGVRLEGPAGLPVVRNRPARQRLLAWGEESVEILFDGGIGPAGGPAELYSLLIRPDGSLRTWRGVDVEPPVGVSRPWASRAEVATRRLASGGWQAELRIPREDFDELAREERLWGMNVIRHDAASALSSAWVVNCGSLHRPAALGTVLFSWPVARRSP